MYEVQMCAYRESEQSGIKDGWYITDAFGWYPTKSEAERVAAQMACLYYEFIDLYCATHSCDGVSFDVVDRRTDEAVSAYELSAVGNVTEWHDEECHEYPNGWKVV